MSKVLPKCGMGRSIVRFGKPLKLRIFVGDVEMTIAQDWARERNGLKRSLTGMLTRCRSMSSCISLMGSEKDYIKRIEAHLKIALSDWDNRNKYSKRKYLREVSK